MPRPIRIKYENAIYHVMNRGQNRQKIFREAKDYQRFMNLLKDCVERWQVQIHAFSLMRNHYHILIQTPLSNISRVMRHIDGLYTQWYNKKYKKDGALFRGRYKSILVEEQGYLVELLRYIHLNPVKAGIVAKPEEHKWSGHRAYVGAKKDLEWMTVDRLKEYFGKTEKAGKENLKKFMDEGVPQELENKLNSKKWPTLLSSEMFQKLIELSLVSKKKDSVIKYTPPRAKKYDVKQINKMICDIYECDWKDVKNPKGLQAKNIRAIVIGMYSKKVGMTYKQITKHLPGIHESTVSRAAKRAPGIDKAVWSCLWNHFDR